MAEPAVSDTSPLLYLARAGFLDLLKIAGPEIVVPRAVVRELQAAPTTEPALAAVVSGTWIRIVDPPAPTEVLIAYDLGEGESSVLAWALAHPQAEVIMDDLAGRRCAAALALPVRGTLGLILAAKRRGMITAARPRLEQLIRCGMYLSSQVLNSALREVGE